MRFLFYNVFPKNQVDSPINQRGSRRPLHQQSLWSHPLAPENGLGILRTALYRARVAAPTAWVPDQQSRWSHLQAGTRLAETRWVPTGDMSPRESMRGKSPRYIRAHHSSRTKPSTPSYTISRLRDSLTMEENIALLSTFIVDVNLTKNLILALVPTSLGMVVFS